MYCNVFESDALKSVFVYRYCAAARIPTDESGGWLVSLISDLYVQYHGQTLAQLWFDHRFTLGHSLKFNPFRCNQLFQNVSNSYL